MVHLQQRAPGGDLTALLIRLPNKVKPAVVAVIALTLALLGTGLTAHPALGAPGPVPGDEWTVEDPAAHGMDATVLDQAREYAFAPGRNTQGVVVVRDGVIVGEWYAPGATKDSYGASWSMAKSFTSALIGIALAEGQIPSVDVPMANYFPEFVGTPREAITLRHVLHMESGLDWLEDYNPATIATSDIVQMVALHPDQLAFAASQPYRVAPGTEFNYSSGDSMLLSGVLEQATGMPAHEYARQKLFAPIGMDQVDWWRDAAGNTLTYCCVDTPSRDFARFGLLYLRGGVWNGVDVVPPAWVNDSLSDTAASADFYGYQWWLEPTGSGIVPPYFSARGHDGQFIYVIPSLDLVVVRNGTYVKSPCPPVADPNLLYYYPPSGLVPGQGTSPPDTYWSDMEFLEPIVASITGAPGAPDQGGPGLSTREAADPAPRSAKASTAAVNPTASPAAEPAPCPATTPTSQATTTTISGRTIELPASPVAPAAVATPRFTG